MEKSETKKLKAEREQLHAQLAGMSEAERSEWALVKVDYAKRDALRGRLEEVERLLSE